MGKTWSIDKQISKLLDVSVFGVSIADPAGEIVYANPALLKLFKTTKENFVGRNAKDFYATPNIRELIISKLSMYNYVKDEEVELVRPDGSHFMAALSFHLTEFAGTNHYFCNFFDLTSRVEMEKKLIDQQTELLEKAYFEEVAKLASKTAHEINNPLTIIKGMLMVLNDEVSSDDSVDREKLAYLLGKSQEAINRIAKGVDELREFSDKAKTDKTLRAVKK